MKPSYHPQAEHIRALVRKNGDLNVRGQRSWPELLRDIYHYLFSLTWPKFFLHVLLMYLSINVTFAFLYFALGVQPAPSTGMERFKECFFFSVETMTAIEYGRIGPSPAIIYVLMTLQALLGILTLATITGLFYARFSRPTARLIFSNKAIIGLHNGQRSFYFRVANERLNQISEARMTLTLTKNAISQEGEHTRKFFDLKLERDYTPLFALSWTVRHAITEDSPLFGMNEKEMNKTQIGIMASLTGIDDTFAQPIIARHVYTYDDIVYNKKFKDIIIWSDKKVHIDLKGIHDLYEVSNK
jgi:inward rectifier potassium channel